MNIERRERLKRALVDQDLACYLAAKVQYSLIAMRGLKAPPETATFWQAWSSLHHKLLYPKSCNKAFNCYCAATRPSWCLQQRQIVIVWALPSDLVGANITDTLPSNPHSSVKLIHSVYFHFHRHSLPHYFGLFLSHCFNAASRAFHLIQRPILIVLVGQLLL